MYYIAMGFIKSLNRQYIYIIYSHSPVNSIWIKQIVQGTSSQSKYYKKTCVNKI